MTRFIAIGKRKHNWKSGRGIITAAIAFAGCFAHSSRGLAQTYTFTNLGSVAGPVINSGYGINIHGDVVGTLGSNPALSTGGGPLTVFGTQHNPVAYAVNDGGEIVGGSDGVVTGVAGIPATNTAFYSAAGGTRAVTPLPTQFNTGDAGNASGTNAAYAVNSNNEVVGVSSLANGDPRAFHWTNGAPTLTALATGSDTGLGDSEVGAQSRATGVNSSGSIVGQASAYAGGTFAPHAFLYSGTKMYDLGTESGIAGTSVAYAINNSGVIAGSSDDNGTTQAFKYTGYTVPISASSDGDTTLNGSFDPLGSLGNGLNYSEALAINSSGAVVGDSYDDDGNQRAIIDINNIMYDLNSLDSDLPAGYTLLDAEGINDAGDITGYGMDAGGTQTAFLLTVSSVPEPTTSGLLMIGGAMFSTRRRRKM